MVLPLEKPPLRVEQILLDWFDKLLFLPEYVYIDLLRLYIIVVVVAPDAPACFDCLST